MSYPSPGPMPLPPQVRGPVRLEDPLYDATFGQAVSRFWRKFGVFSGRASRSEYWWWTLASTGVSFVLQLVGTLLSGGFVAQPQDLDLLSARYVLPLLWSLATFVPALALAVRRLHDTNRSGWWYLLVLPSLIGAVLMLVSLGSLNLEQLATDGPAGMSLAPLLLGLGLLVVGSIGSIVLIVFYILGPDPRGQRFDRAQPTAPSR